MGQRISSTGCNIPVSIKYDGNLEISIQNAQDRTTQANNEGYSLVLVDTAIDDSAISPAKTAKMLEVHLQTRLGVSGATKSHNVTVSTTTVADGSSNNDSESSDDSDARSGSDSDSSDSASSDSDSSDDENVQMQPAFVDDHVAINKALDISKRDTNDHTAMRRAYMILNNGEMDEDDALEAAMALSALDK